VTKWGHAELWVNLTREVEVL